MSQTDVVEIRRSAGDRWMVAFMAGFLIVIALFLLVAGLFSIGSEPAVTAMILALVAFLGGMGYLIAREAVSRWRTRARIEGGKVTFSLPARRSFTLDEPLDTTIDISDVTAVEARDEAFRSFRFITLQRAFSLRLRDGRRLFLGADRPMMAPLFQQLAEEIAARAGLQVADLGLVDGNAGFLGFVGTSSPDWSTPGLPGEVAAKRRNVAAITWRILWIVVGLALGIRVLSQFFGADR